MPKHLFKKEDPELKQKAFKLYKQGFTMREVGKRVRRSRQWVCNIVKELTALDKGVALSHDRRGGDNY